MMLLISLMVAFLSPLTTLVVKSDSVPTIKIFEYQFYTPLRQTKKFLKLSCTASGDPAPRIEFNFHANDVSYGKVLINSSRVQKISATEIIIKNVSAADAGTYRCYAINKNGRVFRNQKIAVAVPGTFNEGAYIGDPATILNVELGREQEIICPVKTYPYPLNQFSWGSNVKGKTPFVIKENERIHITEKGGLYYSLIRQDDVDKINDAGGISCIMNYDGDETFSRKYRLHVEKDNVSHIGPSLHAKITGTTYILEGEKKTLTCIGGGNPVPHITWFKDGVEITNNDSSFTINPNKPGKLIINKFQRDMAGNYKCSLSNQLGTVHSDGNVILAEKPELVTTLTAGRTVAFLGRRLKLKCESKGTEPITYEWYKNGRSLNSYRTLGRSMEINDGNLLIEPVENTTEGTYQCYAINSYGNTYSKTYVFVKEPTVITDRQVGGGTTKPVTRFPKRSEKGEVSGDTLHLKYIIIIACGGAIFLILVGGSIFMYCRSKDNSEEIIFVPTKETGNNDVNRNELIKLELSRTDLKQALLQDLANLPPPPPSLTDHSDDDFSSYGGYKSNHPLYYNDHTMMYLMNHNKEEHLYADIPEDFTRCESATPSTEL